MPCLSQWVANSKHTSSEEALAHRCVEVVYITTLLRDGYGFPEHSRNVTFALESDGMEVGRPKGVACVSFLLVWQWVFGSLGV